MKNQLIPQAAVMRTPRLEINPFEIMQIEIAANDRIKDYRKSLGLETPRNRIDVGDIKCLLSVLAENGFSIIREKQENPSDDLKIILGIEEILSKKIYGIKPIKHVIKSCAIDIFTNLQHQINSINEREITVKWILASDRLPTLEKMVAIKEINGMLRNGNFFKEENEVLLGIHGTAMYSDYTVSADKFNKIFWLDDAAVKQCCGIFPTNDCTECCANKIDNV